ncbi:metallophosphoesterase [Novosphingobium sp. RL4]|uniref:metallophosphoesterase n=1 Tax=Novosphingobium sp. RL4 TaxID=3109595 RepID=UPI002D792239|nr:metallophosphoesterase [Novosphingobium sp. RL4]WRT95872.1 metallophosphoesterase [Novosphingobium sp. RL4]
MKTLSRLLALCTCLTGVALACAPATAADKADDSFTIAVIPDTQNYVDYTHQTGEGFAFDASKMFLDQMAFVAANLKSAGGDIAFVDGLGDNWQHQSLMIDPAHAARGFKRAPNPMMDAHFAPTEKVHTVEMPTVRQGWDMIAGKVPFSVVPGNHDYDAMWTDWNHPPAAQVRSAADVGMLHSGGLSNWKKVFSDQSQYFKDQSWYVASHDDGADSAQIFTAGGYRFLHIGLQFDAPNASLKWAADVIARYPGLPTIVSMHDFLDTAGERLANPIIDNAAADPEDNSPQMIWDKLLSQHDQIFMVLCGHEHAQAFRTDFNKFGHPVYQVLADYQDRAQTAKDAGAKLEPGMGIGDGWLRLMTFDLALKVPQVKVRTYSTHYKVNSVDASDYAKWYKADEKPKLTDEEYMKADDFTIDLTDFRTRFRKPARSVR